ncbi:kinase-like domain-containing protein [Syncephalis pseudoplumigaleata]|uniref:Kinase-like domain-containing protein n=1 Tax=Syncephalis pseudoplumigaleata TaxID=1712513 RepID=A0A4V1J299_9FUNG|nr:kinase-like domain-containing protein [Syncephalis pseudoplumigaleata]|eukprot:RKP27819.1 kinase-like domain-containing protein [Syncephalis pseudoplumigaleata]
MSDFPADDGHCVVTAYGGDEDIGEYAAGLDVVEKGRKLYRLFVQVIRGKVHRPPVHKQRWPSARSSLHHPLGLAYLHRNKIAHGNLCPENILVSYPDMKRGRRPSITIIGFGSSRHVTKILGLFVRKEHSRGTVEFLPPEAFIKEKIDLYKQDVWGVGATVYYCLRREYVFGKQLEGAWRYMPYKKCKKQVADICHGKVAHPLRLTRNPSVAEKWAGLIDIIQAFLVYDPSKRVMTPAKYLAATQKTK